MQMKKGFLVLCIAIILSGCGSEFPDMSEEQSREVAEYAAGLLMKYDEHHESRLLIDAELEKELKRLEALFTRKAELAEMEEKLKEEKETAKEEQKETTVTMPEEEEEKGQYVEEFFGLEGVTIRYGGYHIADAYPESDEEIYFGMQATAGNKLLILEFVAKNETASEISVDMISVAPRFKVGINEESPRFALSTLLMDDLTNYRGTLASGEENALVIIAEIPEEMAEKIESVEAIMQKGTNSATILMD